MHRNPKTITIAALTLILATAAAQAAAPEPKTLPIGAAAPDFQLPGVDGKTYGLKDFAAAKVLVVIFTCNHCPTAQAYEGRLARLHADYRDKGVAVVAISPNDPAAVRLDELGYTDLGDSFDDMKIRRRTTATPIRISTTARRRRPRGPMACWPLRTSTSSTPTASSATRAASMTAR